MQKHAPHRIFSKSRHSIWLPTSTERIPLSFKRRKSVAKPWHRWISLGRALSVRLTSDRKARAKLASKFWKKKK